MSLNLERTALAFAIISDIHSNLEAFTAILDNIRTQGLEKIYCLGDLVGYGANPNECVALARENHLESISGNHDRVSTTLKNIEYFNQHAQKAIRWTHDHLSPSSYAYLATLPDRIDTGSEVMVHGALSERDDYILNSGDAEQNLSLLEEEAPRAQILFFGHTHIKSLYYRGKSHLHGYNESPVHIEPGTRYLINPGSVGQPRDGEPLAAYGIYDREHAQFRHVLVAYDLEKAREKIYQAQLPSFLGDRLLIGK